ncbi:MAG: pentapeptide repeat-containing protein [Halomonas sp.]
MIVLKNQQADLINADLINSDLINSDLINIGGKPSKDTADSGP